MVKKMSLDTQLFDTQLDQYVKRATPTFIDELVSLAGIPSISPGNGHPEDIRRVLDEVTKITQGYGFQTHIVETSGNPAFIGHLETNPNAPWLTVYNHMDVQPAEEPQWKTNPFEPVAMDGKIIGRGTTDDKGPALTIIHAANFLREHGFDMPNIQLVYETEEEIGSPNFGRFLDSNPQLLRRPDSILISDTIFEGNTPAITYKLRGILMVEVELQTGEQELHSGMFGGVAKNPLTILSSALGGLVSPRGEVLIPGFYDGVLEPTNREVDELARVAKGFDFSKFHGDTKLASLYTCDSSEILSRLLHLPTLEIHGYEGAQSEPGVFKTSIPYSVKAKVSMRLVPGQDPDDLVAKLQNHLRTVDPKIRVIKKESIKACVTGIDNPFMQKAAEAYKYGFGLDPLHVGCGGSIGSVPQFQRAYPQSPIVLMALSLMSDGYHAPNEEFRLSQAQKGMRTMARYINSLANLRTA